MRHARIVLAGNTGWGMYNFRLGLVARLRRVGHEVIIVSPPDEYTERLTRAADGWKPVSVDRRGTRPDRDLRTLASFVRTYAMLRPDLVFNYTIKPAMYGTIAARMLAVPNFAMVTGLGSGFLGGSALRTAVTTLYRTALKGADAVFFLNDDDRRYFVEHGMLPERRARSLPGEGVDTDHFALAPLPPLDQGLRLLYCGRLIGDKGLHELIAAVDEARRAGAPVHLGLLGHRDTGNPSCVSEADLARWVQRPHVRHLGRTDDVRAAMAACHCVVLPSYWEGMPRTLLEAGAMGRPILATDVAGCRDVVEHGHNGLLARSRDPGDLAQRIVELCRMDAPTLTAMGLAGRKVVEDGYSDEVVWRRLLPHVDTALGRAPGRMGRSR